MQAGLYFDGILRLRLGSGNGFFATDNLVLDGVCLVLFLHLNLFPVGSHFRSLSVIVKLQTPQGQHYTANKPNRRNGEK